VTSHYKRWLDSLEGIIVEVLEGTVHTSVVVEVINRDKNLEEFEKELLVNYLMRKV
jgi:hypothetical protein